MKVYLDCKESDLPLRGLLSEVEYEAINWQLVSDLIRERNFQGIPSGIWDVLADKILPCTRTKGRPRFNYTHLRARQEKQYIKSKRDKAIKKCFDALTSKGYLKGEAHRAIACALSSENMTSSNVDKIVRELQNTDRLLRRLQTKISG